MHIVVTGASGFVGRVLCRLLIERGHRVTGVVRRRGTVPAGGNECVYTGQEFSDIGTHWPVEAGTVECVVHLAARVHVMKDSAADPAAAFRAMNVDGTLRVAKAAQQHGVRRIVFASSIKAVADTDAGQPLSEDGPVRPEGAYGRSKHDAEALLREFGDSVGLETVIVRPPLVYGPDVRANFLRMMDAVARGIPLPLGSISARRSIVYVENLADALLRCATDPRAAGQCFHVADDDALSVTELLRLVGDAVGKPARLLPVPPAALRAIGRLTGRSAAIERLTGSLQLDTSRIKRVLEWQPPYTTRQGIEATAAWYRSRDTRN
ncbi:N-acetyl-alpha-D-glucosaminyl-diphospho-ditrans,octacis-undecaprenol 4-epimerase [Burkholderia multivorans]|nr:N-acetyl-alpha-D-glucosaminyl-diphospho-ditrans,octacis-undecaprenol 4-epimerase [Burkholderia multivorans]MDR9268995.1 N-acetyl-alpha-D-glucosaminyl-diphospho-ditrans,octacis-undecaprenol 4-epimerase [Burkholderia multivorans]MDR9285833.1 N-acetyl-alpha-D-glucosaminyl-diphospho-ditrans,octacis-undecaprenol 4-epimerase [Burkholderia multivorans]MDR9291588.1 N-acetyl-alpha-D-glucosaminyl-diphospho-ditrans,octacis-undecaprenol 4-epimerase [Burkholderia multivorans]MDR9314985.1 N-acetyl-alpha-D